MSQKIKTALYLLIFIAAILSALWYFSRGSESSLTAFLPSPHNPGKLIHDEKSPFTLPPGFTVSLFANVPGARVMIHASREMGGGLLVSSFAEGKIFLVKDTGEIAVLVDKLKNPHGIAEKCGVEGKCVYYVAEEDNISSYTYNAPIKKLVRKERLVELPKGDGHFTRTLLFLPSPHENILLISVGSSCNVCHEEDAKRAKILAYNIETKEVKEFARGLRNSVFMSLQPVSGEVWATEMGRDLLGDNIPPDEINIVREGKNYGWPNCYGKNVHDGDFDKNTYIRNPCMEPFETPSHIDIPAHSAPLGLAFIPEEELPEEWWHDLLVAYHGSWNRSAPAGYKIVRFPLDAKGNKEGEEVDFMTGFIAPNVSGIAHEAALGRPVDILIVPGGTIYVSDDKAGAVYKILKQG
ncbi:PQQ-dependent sugar dehydrogenase [bacterium]|nr:PQQ-dependent sugar dehydrogenase [bacterium]